MIDDGMMGDVRMMAVGEENGQSEMGWDSDFSCFFERLDPWKVGKKAAAKGLELLGAENMKTMSCPIVMENEIAEPGDEVKLIIKAVKSLRLKTIQMSACIIWKMVNRDMSFSMAQLNLSMMRKRKRKDGKKNGKHFMKIKPKTIFS